MKKDSYPKFYLLVDKRGTILEAGDLRQSSLEKGAEVPLFTFWRDKASAKHTIKSIKDSMTKEVWDTWQFRIVEYKRD